MIASGPAKTGIRQARPLGKQTERSTEGPSPEPEARRSNGKVASKKPITPTSRTHNDTNPSQNKHGFVELHATHFAQLVQPATCQRFESCHFERLQWTHPFWRHLHHTLVATTAASASAAANSNSNNKQRQHQHQHDSSSTTKTTTNNTDDTDTGNELQRRQIHQQ